jgi:hypothetical protein
MKGAPRWLRGNENSLENADHSAGGWPLIIESAGEPSLVPAGPSLGGGRQCRGRRNRLGIHGNQPEGRTGRVVGQGFGGLNYARFRSRNGAKIGKSAKGSVASSTPKPGATWSNCARSLFSATVSRSRRLTILQDAVEDGRTDLVVVAGFGLDALDLGAEGGAAVAGGPVLGGSNKISFRQCCRIAWCSAVRLGQAARERIRGTPGFRAGVPRSAGGLPAP